MNYQSFLKAKAISAPVSGFQVTLEEISDKLKPHQKIAVQWAVQGGRRALFEAFGLGKTAQQLEYCRLVTGHTGGRALIVLPLGVKQEFTEDRVITKDELLGTDVSALQKIYTKYSRDTVYGYDEHVRLAKSLDEDGKLPATFMVVAPASWSDKVWDDINRMRTLNSTQSRRKQQMHVCPLQLDIVERIINRYSNKGDLVYDPFAGLMTVPMTAVKMGRRGYGCELNPDYFRDGVGYLKAAEDEIATPTLFDIL